VSGYKIGEEMKVATCTRCNNYISIAECKNACPHCGYDYG